MSDRYEKPNFRLTASLQDRVLAFKLLLTLAGDIT